MSDIEVTYVGGDIFQIGTWGDGSIFIHRAQILEMLAGLIQAIEQIPVPEQADVIELDLWSRKV